MREASAGRWGTYALIVTVPVLAGAACKPNDELGPIEDPLPLRQVVRRVNFNNHQMNFLLRGGGLSATVRYVDESGPARLEFRGVLIYRKPRDLFLELHHTGQVAMEAGSNDREFWVWQHVDPMHYWWGEHGRMGPYIDGQVPFRPDLLVDVLGLGDLPEDTSGPNGPAVIVREDHYDLLFLDVDPTGQTYVSKVIGVMRYPPFLISSLEYYDVDGRRLMTAHLSGYAQVEGSQVLAPHRIELLSPERESEVRLVFGKMERFENEAAASRFISPRQKGRRDLGIERRLDRPGWEDSPIRELPTTRPVSRSVAGREDDVS